MTRIKVRAKPYWCVHRTLNIPHWVHRAYELDIVGHGHTMAPSRSKVSAWARDYMECRYDTDPDDYEVEVEWLS